ncbi:MAG: TonB-dependent receptor [Calditrichaeota bacterium]|nr:TonB-dependent receptor [Calditrichota bacterium]RQW06618.1 MAG: TonB-dependent receptor [Calditrichota bacterium]
MYRISVIYLLLFFLVASLLAGTTGKIAGFIRDKDNKEPLIGVNIQLQGTNMGAATDAEGFFFITNIPPGKYVLQITYIGYTTVQVENVIVTVDHTTEVNMELEASSIELDETITVIAERPLIQKDATSRRSIVEGNQISDILPVNTVQGVLALQAGAVSGEGGEIHIRGGRSGEIGYLVDGTYVRDPFDNTLGGRVDVEAIQEMEMISGTFNAEYGNAMSAIVNLVTKEGSNDYKFKLQYESPMLNESPYHQKDWLLQTDEVKNLPPEEQKQYRDAVRLPNGESAYRQFRVADSRFSPTLTGLDVMGKFNGSVSGPVPLFQKMKFFLSTTLQNENSYLPYGFTLDRIVSGKLNYDLTTAFKVQFSADWSNSWYQDYDHQYKYWQYFDEINNGGYPLTRDYKTRFSLKTTHTLSKSTYYTLSLSYLRNKYRDTVDDKLVLTDPNTGELLYSEYVTRSYYQGIEGNFRPGDVRYWTNTDSKTFDVDADIVSQATNHHQVKGGVEFRQHEISRHRIGMPPRGLLEYFTKKPYEFAVYLQDKIELAYLVMNLGLRFDFYDPQDSYYPDPARILLLTTDPDGQSIITTVPEQDVKPKYKLSPRIGLAHPISATTVFHFAYGHFFQIPRYYDLFRDNDLDDIVVNDALVGNPGLEPEKTVAFEAGFKQQLGQDYALDIAAYYKDISNLISSFYYFSGRDYTIFINADYGKVQGVDVSLTKRYSNYFSGALNYTFMIAKGNESDPIEGYSSYREDDAHLKPNRNFYLDFDRRHTVSLNLDVRFPGNFGPSLLGVNPLGDFSMNFLLTAAAGLPYTPTSRDPDATIAPEKNSARKPGVNQLDLRITKDIHVWNTIFRFYVRGENVLDRINVVRVWTATGKAWDGGPTSNYPKDRQANPESVDVRRRIYLGLIVRF